MLHSPFEILKKISSIKEKKSVCVNMFAMSTETVQQTGGQGPGAGAGALEP